MRLRWPFVAFLTIALLLLTSVSALAITWSSRASLATPRAGVAAAVAGTKIYALGGFNAAEPTAAASYDTTTNAWSAIASMPTKRGGLAAATSHGKVYA